MSIQGVLFDKRFLETYAGQNILHSPRTAIVELVANAWDAGATKVDITWPDTTRRTAFSISDNGHGMTDAQFSHRWRTLAYDRVHDQGDAVEVVGKPGLAKRRVFGRSGVGRFAGFCFGDSYLVSTWREGQVVTYRVKRGEKQPLAIEKLSASERRGTGTAIHVEEVSGLNLTAADARAEIGMRFLTDPTFMVLVDAEAVSFSDIDEGHVEEFVIQIPGHGELRVVAIDTQKTDRTTKQHGVAWHVNGRLVGDCSWKGQGREELIDGRRIAAKRFTFIIYADYLEGAVKKDWSGFEEADENYLVAVAAAYEHIGQFMQKTSEEDRRETFDKVRKENESAVSRLSPVERDRWQQFVQETQVKCPSIQQRDLVQLGGVLAKLEESRSRYALIQKLGELTAGQLDELHALLKDWTIDMAKIVLDEIQTRMQLLQQLKRKVVDEKTDEVQELQPLFKQGLWIFGPEFETIEFTANEGMTTVIQRLVDPGSTTQGSRNRPDFVVIPDGSVGFYSYPTYDEHGGELGTARLVIIELKKPGILIGAAQKDQCWKYVRELMEKGSIQASTIVDCYPLGEAVDAFEVSARVEGKNVRIQPLRYDTVVERAKSRLLKLYDRVKSAPIFEKAASSIAATTSTQAKMF